MINLNLSDTAKASFVVNYLITSGKMKAIILDMEPLDTRYTAYTNKRQIAGFTSFFKDFDTDVVLWKPWNRWSRAYATTITGNFSLIKLNSRRLNRSFASICGTIAHELGHNLESYTRQRFPMVRFNHGDNSPVGKGTTFQYQLGRRVKAYIEEHGNDILRDLGIN